MRFDILTIFPQMLDSPLQEGIIRRAVAAGKVSVNIHDIRDFALDKHAMTDDRPFGGGEGMVMKPEPIAGTLGAIEGKNPGGRVIFLSPKGKTYTQEKAERLAAHEHLILLCGRYEGVDERIRANYVDEEISIGDYILTGGELAAMVLIDSITRLLPGVLGCEDSAENDTFSRGLLKNPQYTRPREFAGHAVPEILLSGDHAAIAEWRLITSVQQTLKKRPELLARAVFSKEDMRILKKYGLFEAVQQYKNTAVKPH
jgi:tRNA (guanine37-N1)-methyltransferase